MVNWHCKSEKIEFYNDKEDHIERPPRPRKPRRSKYQTEEQYKARIEEWEALLPHEVIVKPNGNSMI